MESWYFAYGSNLWMDQMIERTGAIYHAERAPRIAHLANHRLVFQHLEKAGPAFANILSSGDGVVGVVYRCSPADFEKLDRYERGYERQTIMVTDVRGEVLPAAAYVLGPAQAFRFGKPTSGYLERIVTGARQHGLPEQYIASIVTIASSGSVL
jgi:cation transport regulator ChaC